MTENLEILASYLKLLGHPIRLQTALLLFTQLRTVSDLEQLLQVRQPNLSQHLAVLREAGLLRSAREAKSVTYAINHGLPQQLIAALSAMSSPTAAASMPPPAEHQRHSTPQHAGDELVFATVRFPPERD